MNSQNSSGLPGSAGGTVSGGGASTETSALAKTKTGITEAARESASKVKSAVSSTAARAREEAGRIASEKKEIAADRISRYGSAIHESAKTLEEKDPNIAWFTHRAADRLQNAADYMRSRDFSRLRYDAEEAARRHPAVFFGGMFLAGLILGNVVKASRRKVEDHRFADEGDDQSGWARASDQSDRAGTTRSPLTESAASTSGI